MLTSGSSNYQSVVDTSRPFGYLEWLLAKERLLSEYPFVAYEAIGKSVAGRELGAFRIGTGGREIHYNAAMHANEWLTGLVQMKFLEELCQAVEAGTHYGGRLVTEWLQDTSIWLVPLVNPDGVELVLRGPEAAGGDLDQLIQWNGGSTEFNSWKANLRGVDLNDQFPAYWETERDRRAVELPGPRDYTGESPLSEPEAMALAELTRRRSFELAVAFHSQGREIYWNYRGMEPAESVVWAERFKRVSGYVPIKLEGSDAGYKDWFIQEYRKPAFTVEVGFGTNPLPLEQVGQIYKEASGIMLEGLKP